MLQTPNRKCIMVERSREKSNFIVSSHTISMIRINFYLLIVRKTIQTRTMTAELNLIFVRPFLLIIPLCTPNSNPNQNQCDDLNKEYFY